MSVQPGPVPSAEEESDLVTRARAGDSDAMGALQNVYETQGAPREIDRLRDASAELLRTMDELTAYFDQLDSMLSQFLPGDTRIGAVAENILTFGDLNILDFIAGVLDQR